jgi:phosphatidylethanolamine/phosphatidyl-N-methylethanolamine N-methyltransferase
LFDPPGSPPSEKVVANRDAVSRALSVTEVENDFVEDVYTKISSWYDLFFGPTLHAGRLEAIRRLPLRPGCRILEVGIGTGINAPLYPRDCFVTGIDFSASMLAKAGRRIKAHGVRNVDLIRMDAADLRFADESFDIVYAPHVVVLNHFRSRNRLLARVERILSPLTVHIGFKADLDLPGFLEQTGFDPISIEKVNIPRIWSLVTFRKEA